MTIQLNKSWRGKLAQLPESGMGSQHVDFTLKNGRVIRDVVVFNGEECHTDQPFDPDEIATVKMTTASQR